MTLAAAPAPLFTVTPLDLNAPANREITMADLDVMGCGPNSRALKEVVPAAKGCISEDENRERLGRALALDFPSVAALKGTYAGQKLIICGGGASLARTLPDILKTLRRGKRAKILAVNKTHDWLIARGVVPTFGVLMDPRPHIADYMTPHRGVKYLLGASVDARIFATFAAAPYARKNVYLWHPIGTAGDMPYVRDILQKQFPWKSVAMIPGPSTVGLRSLYLAMDILGFTTIELHGFDSCYDCDTAKLWPYDKAVSFEPVKIQFTIFSKTDGAKFTCVSNPDMARQVYEFDKMIDLLIGSVRAGKRRFLPNITVAGDGAIPWMAWKNGGHATPARMMAKYGEAREWTYSEGAKPA